MPDEWVGRPMEILLIEDNQGDARLTIEALKEVDVKHRLTLARNGEEAIAAIREHRPDLVFLDVMMPRINGFEVTEQVRADPDLADVKIILLTAKGQESDREVGKTAGANDYMTKPFSPTKILERAREVLGS